MQFENLLFETDGNVATVTMNRPARLNSLSTGLLNDLTRCAEALSGNAAIRAVILTAAGRGFCAGADLTEDVGSPEDGTTHGEVVAARLQRHFHPALLAWSGLRAPVVVAVNGVAAGAGVSLALAGDITIAARSATFSVLFAPKLGLVPDMGATHFLPSRIGVARARYLSMTGLPVTAERAEQMGMIAEVADDEALAARSQELAAQLASGPTRAFIAVRELMAEGGARPLERQIEHEAAAQRLMADTADFAEGLAAFRGKRTPRFQGR
jgi:2-(1,2-epoxy-1,2-dihydrophenyl)acetyl-CoA isomerase